MLEPGDYIIEILLESGFRGKFYTRVWIGEFVTENSLIYNTPGLAAKIFEGKRKVLKIYKDTSKDSIQKIEYF